MGQIAAIWLSVSFFLQAAIFGAPAKPAPKAGPENGGAGGSRGLGFGRGGLGLGQSAEPEMDAPIRSGLGMVQVCYLIDSVWIVCVAILGWKPGVEIY